MLCISCIHAPSEFSKITLSLLGFIAVAVVLYTQIDLFQEGIQFLGLRFEEAARLKETQ